MKKITRDRLSEFVEGNVIKVEGLYITALNKLLQNYVQRKINIRSNKFPMNMFKFDYKNGMLSLREGGTYYIIQVENYAYYQNPKLQAIKIGNAETLLFEKIQNNCGVYIDTKENVFLLSLDDFGIIITNENLNNKTVDVFISYKNMIKQYQHTIAIKKDQYNYSLNPTWSEQTEFTMTDDSVQICRIPKKDDSGEIIDVYITAIGLYNNKDQLVAIAKPSIPIKKSKFSDLFITVNISYT